MQPRRTWLRRGTLAATILCTTALGAATTYAEVTASETRLTEAHYRLQTVTSGVPCDAWEWNQIAGPSATITDDDQATAEAVVGIGLYVFQATCIRGEGGDQTTESSAIVIDTRPSAPDESRPRRCGRSPTAAPCA